MKKLCLNCDKPLVGRQRQFCADKCRKAYKRKSDKFTPKSDKTVPEVTYSEENNGILSAFTSDLSDLDPFLKVELVKNFTRLIDYQTTWLKRTGNHEKKHPHGVKLSKMHDVSRGILEAVRDEITEALQ